MIRKLDATIEFETFVHEKMPPLLSREQALRVAAIKEMRQEVAAFYRHLRETGQ